MDTGGNSPTTPDFPPCGGVLHACRPHFQAKGFGSFPQDGFAIETRALSCGRAKVLRHATAFAKDHALSLLPFPSDAREKFPSDLATTLEKIKPVVGTAIV